MQVQERPWRTGLKPLNILQPEGPSFQVQGNHVRWQKWDFRVSFNYREGLVFHNVGYGFIASAAPIRVVSMHAEMPDAFGCVLPIPATSATSGCTIAEQNQM